jgi:NACalpha-BTF3-like transcription factor
MKFRLTHRSTTIISDAIVYPLKIKGQKRYFEVKPTSGGKQQEDTKREQFCCQEQIQG